MKARTFRWILLAGALLLGSLAWAQQLAPQDEAFLEQAAHNGQAEISAGRLALTKARHPEVSTFARRMVDDYTRLDKELRTLATDRRFDAPKEPSALQKGKEMMIGGLGDDTFDRRYMNQLGVEAHKSSIQLFEKASRESQDPEVKAFASRHLPALRQHLQTAQELKAVVDGGNSPPTK